MNTVEQILADVPTGHYIDGRWTDDATTLPVENPATGTTLTHVADADPATGMAALDAASRAQSAWAATDPRARSDILMAAFGLIHERAEQFATLITLEMGKPLTEARGEVAYGAEFFRWFAEEGVRASGSYVRAPSGGHRIMTLKQPVGPVFAITPWNFPLAMGTRKIAPALAAGCTVVLKPAPQTPLTTLALMEVLDEAGLPAGVVNCVTTSNAPELSLPIITDPRLRKLTFTGSTAVGRALTAQAAERMLRVSMELGGNAPFVVLESANLDRAVTGAVAAKMRNTGEACTAANRFLIHESLAEEFGHRFADALAQLTVGNGMDAGTDVGPLIDAVAVAKVTGLVDDATDRGARVLTGGKAVSGPGHFVQPTVLTDLDSESAILREEIFGPIAPLRTFRTADEAVAMANDTDAGLIGYVFAESISEALAVSERLETGMIGLNSGVVSNPAAPFGGVKSSGLGREGGAEGLDEYLETKYIGLAL
ncbi:NAD-dependent succinate-semialdehyde dehydrogenase [Nocardia cyriacigeorgica]|uniref:NAD-dependent succinate-semialdehyde dehydrogenase n=1 Tax=Nocardia cyriacigeorgica TaxID=135487 RepID=A0A6P1D858_9NOCA|nr:NAD-dependent succinate-semialdehyde dehydrogenase [Nocardia cyriacigeorgica]NEW38151.1 NAD-dependent succinate-semialdehyde dehydrogenase [Nocardia cyriacigeorgica]NEW45809.1 NAD-dependent succinate-semialdehyde dehydrogenase [Nocardia cyriacigeorgica]NEW57546.1 NAD-dependent succinate-semialdehyde dehydrogenase [Nocardia cyriacigeorgica]